MARHPGSVRRHGRGFEVRLCIAGVRHSFTLRCEDVREARAWAKKKEAVLERQADRHGPERATAVRMSELLVQFEHDEVSTKAPGTIGAYGDSLKAIRVYFLNALGDPRVDRVTPAHVRAFITWRRAHRIRCRKLPDGTAALDVVPGATQGRTVSKDRAVLHQLFALAEDFEYREGNPVTRRTTVGRISTREPVILTDVQYDALLDAASADPVLQLYLLAVGETGARNESEVLQLQWGDVDFTRGDITVGAHHKTKTGRQRFVPMSSRLATAMRAHFSAFRFAGSPWIFHHQTTRRRYTEGERITSLHRAVQTAAERAKLPTGWRCYDLRHRAITNWRLAGKPDAVVAAAVGHASLAMTRHYTHVERANVRMLVEDPTPKAAAQA